MRDGGDAEKIVYIVWASSDEQLIWMRIVMMKLYAHTQKEKC